MPKAPCSFIKQGLLFCLVKGGSVRVLFHGIEAVMVLTLIILKQRALLNRPHSYDTSRGQQLVVSANFRRVLINDPFGCT